MNPLLKRLATWLGLADQPPVDLSTATLPVPSGGFVRVGRPLPSYLACRPELPAPEPIQCRRCSYRNQDAASRFFVRCAVNPLGPETDPCQDFQLTTEEDECHD